MNRLSLNLRESVDASGFLTNTLKLPPVFAVVMVGNGKRTNVVDISIPWMYAVPVETQFNGFTVTAVSIASYVIFHCLMQQSASRDNA